MGSDKQTKFRAKFLPKAGPGRTLSWTTEAHRGGTLGKQTGQLRGHRYLGGRSSYRLYRRKDEEKVRVYWVRSIEQSCDKLLEQFPTTSHQYHLNDGTGEPCAGQFKLRASECS